MSGVQVSIACLALLVTFNLCTAQPRPCPTCPEGYFVEKNCSDNGNWKEGVRCKPCTDCSAADQVTLVRCSTFADSLCGNRSSATTLPTHLATEPPGELTWRTPPPALHPVSVSEVWIILPVMILLILILLLSLRACHKSKQYKFTGLENL